MDISIVSKNSIKLKGKLATFIVDPSKEMPKIQADAVILLNSDYIDVSRVGDFRIIINGAGEYEINGVKISGTTTPKGVLYKLLIDDLSIILGRTSESKTEGFSSCQIAVINTDAEFNESFVTALEPKITVIYGNAKAESAKVLGLENPTFVPKVTITKEKLPEKMEVIILN